MPQSIAAIREQLARDRRENERRWGKRDSRVFRRDRRSDERRLPRNASSSEAGVDEDMIIEISELVSELELLSLEVSGTSRGDLTCIQERPNLENL